MSGMTEIKEMVYLSKFMRPVKQGYYKTGLRNVRALNRFSLLHNLSQTIAFRLLFLK